MTEQELRDKISDKVYEILRKSSILQDGKRILTLDINGINKTAERIAYTLISARIGDVSEYERLKTELRSKVDYIHELWDVKEDYKHRAEVAEKDNIKYGRALYNLAVKYVSAANIWTITADDGKKYLAEKEICALYVIDSEIKNAEKELQEERKDD